MPHRFEATGDFVARLEGTERAAAIPRDRIVERMGSLDGRTVVDIGAGTGYFTVPISKVAGEVVSVDIEPRMLRLLSGRLQEMALVNVHLVCGDILLPPIADRSVDHVLAAFVYHEVSSKKDLIGQCARMLVRGGTLTIVDFQKRETGFGPPVRERKPPEHVMRTAMRFFQLVHREETEVYYQLEFEKK